MEFVLVSSGIFLRTSLPFRLNGHGSYLEVTKLLADNKVKDA